MLFSQNERGIVKKGITQLTVLSERNKSPAFNASARRTIQLTRRKVRIIRRFA